MDKPTNLNKYRKYKRVKSIINEGNIITYKMNMVLELIFMNHEMYGHLIDFEKPAECPDDFDFDFVLKPYYLQAFITDNGDYQITLTDDFDNIRKEKPYFHSKEKVLISKEISIDFRA